MAHRLGRSVRNTLHNGSDLPDQPPPPSRIARHRWIPKQAPATSPTRDIDQPKSRPYPQDRTPETGASREQAPNPRTPTLRLSSARSLLLTATRYPSLTGSTPPIQVSQLGKPGITQVPKRRATETPRRHGASMRLNRTVGTHMKPKQVRTRLRHLSHLPRASTSPTEAPRSSTSSVATPPG